MEGGLLPGIIPANVQPATIQTIGQTSPLTMRELMIVRLVIHHREAIGQANVPIVTIPQTGKMRR